MIKSKIKGLFWELWQCNTNLKQSNKYSHSNGNKKRYLHVINSIYISTD